MLRIARARPPLPQAESYTQGGTPDAAQLETVFAQIGRMVAERLA